MKYGAATALFVAMVLLSACSRTLVLHAVNDGNEPAVTVIEGEDPTIADDPMWSVSWTVDGNESTRLETERETGSWSIAVNGQVVTDSGEWPDDNPEIDLTIRIAEDGSAVVEDT